MGGNNLRLSLDLKEMKADPNLGLCYQIKQGLSVQFSTRLGLEPGCTRNHSQEAWGQGWAPSSLLDDSSALFNNVIYPSLCIFLGHFPHVHYYLFSDAEFHWLFPCMGTQDMVRHALQCQWFGISHRCHFTLCSLFPSHLCYLEQHNAQHRSLAQDRTSSVPLPWKFSISSYHFFPTAKTVITPKDSVSHPLLHQGTRLCRLPEPLHTV